MMTEAPVVTGGDPPSDPPSTLVNRLVETFRRAYQRARLRREAENIELPAAYRQRPPGWAGHWSETYARLLARTLGLDPPIKQTQSELLAAIPRPLQETFDPAVSSAERLDRDGRLVGWTLARSPLLDLFGPVGLVIGGFALSAIVFQAVVSRFDLPALLAQQPTRKLQQPPQEQIKPSRPPSSATAQPDPQTQRQPISPPAAPSAKPADQPGR